MTSKDESLPMPLDVWVLERFENCIRIAGEKVGADREGWLEDAKFFRAILRRLQPETTEKHLIDFRVERGMLIWTTDGGGSRQATAAELLMFEEIKRLSCEDCPPAEYPTDKTRCAECPRRAQKSEPKPGPLCPQCKTELAFEGDVCGLCFPVAQP